MRASRVATVVGLLGLIGCSSTKSASVLKSTPGARTTTLDGSSVATGPAAVVEKYYAACTRGDAAEAARALSPQARALESGTTAPMWTNIARLTGLTVASVRPDPGGAQDGEPGFTDITQVTVEFNVLWKDYGKAGSSNGQTTNFDIVGRAADGSGWRILSVGFGP